MNPLHRTNYLMLAVLAAAFSGRGTKAPEWPTLPEREAPDHIKQSRIAKAQAKRARKNALRLAVSHV